MANIKFQNVLNNIPQNIPPIWMMRQAGRYHKHYQKLREKHSFWDLCKIPELAAETALGPILDFDFDISILFSDILFPLDAMGLGLHYTEKGPILEKKITTDYNFSKIPNPDELISYFDFQNKAVSYTRNILPKDKSLIGFVGGNWTLWKYATMDHHYSEPVFPKTQTKLRNKFLEIINPLILNNIGLQLSGGAEVVMILDTSAGDLDLTYFKDIVINFLKLATERFPNKIGYYSKSISESYLFELNQLKELAGFGIDHRFEITTTLKNSNKFIQGNFDHTHLLLESNELEIKLIEYLQTLKNLEIKERSGWICNLSHGILPNTPEKNVQLFVNKVREFFK